MIGVMLSISKCKEINYIGIFVTQSERLVFKCILSLSNVIISYTLVKECSVSKIYFINNVIGVINVA
jgi:hypothetical protein